MAEILQIDPTTKLEAVRRQLAQMRNQRVALAVPDGWPALDNAAQMRLLQRQAQIQRCELGVITRNETLRRAAKQMGVPIFANAEESTQRNWRMHPLLPLVDPHKPEAALPAPPPWRRSDLVKRMARPTLHQARQRRIRSEERYRRPLPAWLQLLSYTFVGGLIVLLLAGFTVYILPAATISITPGREAVTLTVSLIADPDLAEPDMEARRLPARLIERTLEVTGTIPTSGATQKATDRARGQVIFSNLGSSTVNIPVGTIVSTGTGSPVSFRTTAPADLSGGIGARVTAPIEAIEPGIEGNVRANAINTVEGAARFRVRVINEAGTIGGGAALSAVVAQEDRDNLLAQLQAVTQARAAEALQQELVTGEWLPSETVQTFVVAQAFSAFKDEEAAQLDLTLRTLVRGVAVSEESTREALLSALQQNIPARGKLVASSFTMQRLPGATPLERSVQFTVSVQANYVVPVDPAEVRQAVVGIPADEAVRLIQSRWLVAQTPGVYQDPDWFGVLPRLGRRIQVRIEYAAAEQ
jgi:hypothetical protein